MTIETQRLVLRKLERSDAAFICTLLNSPGWLKYIGDRNVRSPNDAVRYLEEGPLKSYEVNGFGLMKVTTKDGGAPVGLCGLLRRDHLPAPDIGFAFLAEHCGLGYGTESANAILETAPTYGLHEVYAITTPDNVTSQALLRKLGFVYADSITNPATGEELSMWKRSISNS